MEKQLHRLEVVLLAVGSLHLLAGVVMAAFPDVTPFSFREKDVETFVGVMTSLASLLLIAGGVAGLIAGWMLLRRLPRSRIIGIGSSFFLLIVPPFGTLAGAYGIWLLFQEESDGFLGENRARDPAI